MGDAPRFRPVDAVVLRGTTVPHAVRPTAGQGLLDADADVLASWISDAWGSPRLAAAVEEASPDLARQVRSVVDGATGDSRRLRRTALALARYGARWWGRATPFGLFAGVVPVRLGDRAEVVWGDRHHHRRTVDGRWLADMVGRLEADRAVRGRLTVVRSDLAARCGDRLVVPVPVGRGEQARSVSVRLTGLVARLLDLARSPVEVGRLALAVVGEGADTGAVEDVVGDLLRCGALISCLTPSSTVTDATAHVLERLRSLPGGVPRTVEALVEEITAAAAGRHVGSRRASETTAAPTPPVWRTDVLLGCAVTVPVAVADEAARAVQMLLRFSPAPTGHPGWRRFHARFLDRFGAGAVVALEDALNPTTGVGLPEHLTEDDDTGTAERDAPLTARDRVLLRLAQHAVLDGTGEVVLDEFPADGPLVPGEPDFPVTGAVGPSHVDVCVDLRAGTRAELDAGRFTIGVSSVGRSAIATAGRFLGVVDAQDRERMIADFARLPVAVSGAELAQVSFPVLRLAARTAAAVPPVLGRVIAVGEHTRPDTVGVRDLAVLADHHRLYLVSRRDHRVIEPAAVNALARHATPALARVLLELPRARTARITAWDWGAAACLPLRPRVRHGRAVLSPAAWTLHRPHPAGAGPVVRTEVTRLREHHGWPRFVHAGRGDRQLRLDLDDATDVDLLREHLRRTVGPVEVTEAPAPAEHGWIDGRAHEVVIPLAATSPPAPAPAALTRRSRVVIPTEHGDLPGASTADPILSARLTCRADAVDSILVDHLPALLDRFAVPPRWWFLRHRTPAQFLRLRLHVPRYGDAAEQVGEWATQLRNRGLSGDLVLDTYRPELARYGATAAARTAVEAVFAADSAAARAQIALLSHRRHLDPVALTTASMIDLLCAAHTDRAAGLAWLVARTNLAAGAGRTDRAQLAQVLDLLHPAAPPDEVSTAWRDRKAAVQRYAREVGKPDGPPADTVLVSLLHLHYVRALGVDPAGEQRCHRLARAAAMSQLARPTPLQGRPETA